MKQNITKPSWKCDSNRQLLHFLNVQYHVLLLKFNRHASGCNNAEIVVVPEALDKHKRLHFLTTQELFACNYFVLAWESNQLICLYRVTFYYVHQKHACKEVLIDTQITDTFPQILSCSSNYKTELNSRISTFADDTIIAAIMADIDQTTI